MVVSNPSTSRKTLQKLATYPDITIKQNIIGIPNTPAPVLVDLTNEAIQNLVLNKEYL